MGENLFLGKQEVCGARTRSGKLCRRLPVFGKKRCHYHGGRSTGPKTADGKLRIALARTKHGRYSKQAIAERHEIRSLINASRDFMNELRQGANQ